jgi:flavodoxin
MKTLVVFYSRNGNTRKMAQLIAKDLGAHLEEIIDLKDRRGLKGWLLGGRDASTGALTQIKTFADPSDYDLVIVGTPIWAWNATPAIRTYLSQFKTKIKRVAFFTTSSSSSPDKTIAFMESFSGHKSVASTGWTEMEIKSQSYQSKLDDFLHSVNL